jgi:hypothetical protein
LSRAAWLIPEQSDKKYRIEDIDRVLVAMLDPLQLEYKRIEAVALRAELTQKRDAAYAAICEWIGEHHTLRSTSAG